MAGPSLSGTNITQKVGLSPIEDGYICVEDVLTKRIWTDNYELLESGGVLTLFDRSGNVIGVLGTSLGPLPRTLNTNQVIPAGYSSYMVDTYEIAAGITLEIGLDAALEIG